MMDQDAPEYHRETVLRSLEEQVRGEIERAQSATRASSLVLQNLILARDASLFSEELVARIRAMISGLAIQLLDALAGPEQSRKHSVREVEVFARALLDSPALLNHVHALALEWQLAERLQRDCAWDTAMSPRVTALLTCDDPRLAALAQQFLASQSRWSFDQRRMHLPLLELPQEHLDVALYTLRSLAAVEVELAERSTAAENRIRAEYAEETTRLGLAAQLVLSINGAAQEKVDLQYDGLALFLTTLAFLTKSNRDTLAISTHESQLVQVMLSLRSVGLDWMEVQRHLQIMAPDTDLPAGFGELNTEQVSAFLAAIEHVQP